MTIIVAGVKFVMSVVVKTILVFATLMMIVGVLAAFAAR